jgi:hypothetical protein
MSYSAVPTVSTGDLWSAANHNTYIRDNFAAGVPDIFTAAGDIAYATAANAAVALPIGTTNQSLLSSSDGLPFWGDPPIIAYRQGGSATAWDLAGTTNYTLTAEKTIIQGGSIIVHTNAGASQGSGTLTYPTAFANIPLTFVQLLTTPSPTNHTFNNMVVQSRSATGCTIYINYSGSQTGAIDDSVEWFASGDIA